MCVYSARDVYLGCSSSVYFIVSLCFVVHLSNCPSLGYYPAGCIYRGLHSRAKFVIWHKHSVYVVLPAIFLQHYLLSSPEGLNDLYISATSVHDPLHWPDICSVYKPRSAKICTTVSWNAWNLRSIGDSSDHEGRLSFRLSDCNVIEEHHSQALRRLITENNRLYFNG